MTDEEYGRAWAKQQGREPYGDYRHRYFWFGDNNTSPAGLPVPVIAVALAAPGVFPFESESAAYAALGSAVRRVREMVPGLKGEPQ